MNKPTISLFELGSGLAVVAGMESVEGVTRPVETAHFKVSGLFEDTSASFDTIKNYLRDLDTSAESLHNDIEKNVKRDTFLQSWNVWILGWKKFYSGHESTLQITLAGRDSTMTQAKEFGRQLDEWRVLYSRETGGSVPSGVMPSVPKTQENQGWLAQIPTSTKIVVLLVGTGVLAFIGYATYRYVKKMRSDVDRAENFAKGLAEKTLIGNSSSFSGGATHARMESGE